MHVRLLAGKGVDVDQRRVVPFVPAPLEGRGVGQRNGGLELDAFVRVEKVAGNDLHTIAGLGSAEESGPSINSE
jgi:hypothetical protein